MRILHLLDGGCAITGEFDAAAGLCGRIIARSLDDHAVLVLGPAGIQHRAASLGLRPDFRLTPPAARTTLAWRGIRAARKRWRAEAVCCWDRAALSAAVLTLGRDTPIVHVGPEPANLTGPLSPRRFDSIGYEAMEAPPIGEAPGLAPREELRRSLGIQPHERAALLLCTSDDASVVRFAFTLGLARRAGEPVVGIIPAWADQISRARHYESRLSTGVRLVETPLPLRDTLPAADLALWPGGGRSTTWLPQGRPSRLASAMCLAAGVPLIAPRGLGIDDLYPHEVQRECLAEIGMPPELARRLYPLVLEPGRVRSLAELCRAHWRGRDGTPELARAISAACGRVATTGGWGEVVVRQMATAPEGA